MKRNMVYYNIAYGRSFFFKLINIEWAPVIHVSVLHVWFEMLK